jgi:hypothetical protein
MLVSLRNVVRKLEEAARGKSQSRLLHVASLLLTPIPQVIS